MPNAFNFNASPFDALTAEEQRIVRSNVDVAYFRSEETILELGANPSHLYILIKGVVHQLEGSEVVNTYTADDCFDGRGLVAEKTSSRFIAAEEVLAYQLSKKAVSSLIASNATFGALLFSDLSNKLSAISQRDSQHQLRSLTMARVDEAYVRPPVFVDANTDIVSVVKLFQSARSSTILVRDQAPGRNRVGIFTHTGLQRAILSGTPLDVLQIRDMATFSLISVRPSDQLGDALALMIQKRIHRVVVSDLPAAQITDPQDVIGVLEAMDLFSFLSNHSYLISLQISEAGDLVSLQRAAEHVNRLIALLHDGGTKVSLIATLVGELNARLFERAWQLIAPADLVANSCLFVMGSEGRGEQLLKTDQDNGLILREGYNPPADLGEICNRFSRALSDFGYPPCPGNIMISNPMWCQGAAQFGQMTRQWLIMPSPESLMSLAIFLDADAVCGAVELLEEVRLGVFNLVQDNDAMLARFASAINSFSESGGWWNRLLMGEQNESALDLKKAGLFPLVHGVRCLALEQRIMKTGTVARIEELVAAGVLDATMAHDLIESLHFFMGLRLKAGLAERASNKDISGGVLESKLSSLDRDLLKDTLGVVKRFRQLIRLRFRLDMVS